MRYYSQRRRIMSSEIIKAGADIVCLQEVWQKHDVIAMVEQLSEEYPYNYFHRFNSILPFSQSNGLMFFSHYPMSNERYIPFKSFLFKRGALVATFMINQKPMRVACTHLTPMMFNIPYFGDFKNEEEEQTHQVRTLLTLEPDLHVVAGDFNSGPANPPSIVAYSPDPYYYLRDHGFTSAIVKDHPSQCSWCDHNTLAEVGYGNLIIDHVFINNKYKWRSSQIVLDQPILVEKKLVFPSDHFGVIVDIEWNAK